MSGHGLIDPSLYSLDRKEKETQYNNVFNYGQEKKSFLVSNSFFFFVWISGMRRYHYFHYLCLEILCLHLCCYYQIVPVFVPTPALTEEDTTVEYSFSVILYSISLRSVTHLLTTSDLRSLFSTLTCQEVRPLKSCTLSFSFK